MDKVKLLSVKNDKTRDLKVKCMIHSGIRIALHKDVKMLKHDQLTKFILTNMN